MRKFIVVLMILSLVLSSCGKKEEPEKETVEEVEIEDVKVDQDKDTTTVSVTEGQETVVSNEMGKSVPIPEDYPMDLFPVYKDAYVAVAMTNPDNSFSLVFFSKDSIADVVAFYDEVLEEADVISKQKEEDFFFSMGELDGSTYTVNVAEAEEEGYASMTSLVVVPGQSMGLHDDDMTDTDDKDQAGNQTSDEPKIEADIVIPDDVDWPEDFPEVVPVYPTGKTEAAMVMAQGNQKMVGIMTEDEVIDVVEFYKELFVDANDYMEMNMDPNYQMAGTIDGSYVQIIVGPNVEMSGEEDRFRSLIQIIYEVE